MKKKIGAFGARQFSLETLVGGRPGTTIFQNPGGGGGGGGGWGGSHTRTGPGRPPVTSRRAQTLSRAISPEQVFPAAENGGVFPRSFAVSKKMLCPYPLPPARQRSQKPAHRTGGVALRCPQSLLVTPPLPSMKCTDTGIVGARDGETSGAGAQGGARTRGEIHRLLRHPQQSLVDRYLPPDRIQFGGGVRAIPFGQVPLVLVDDMVQPRKAMGVCAQHVVEKDVHQMVLCSTRAGAGDTAATGGTETQKQWRAGMGKERGRRWVGAEAKAETGAGAGARLGAAADKEEKRQPRSLEFMSCHASQ